MGKTIRRLMQDGIYAVGLNENWLADMSRRGLHLKMFGRFLIHFEQDELGEIRA